MADPWPLRRSRRLQGEEPEVSSGESLYNFTPLQHFRPIAFTIDPESRDADFSRKRHKTEPSSDTQFSDSLNPSHQSFPSLDPAHPPFGITAPFSSMEGLNSTATSSTSFSTESVSPARTSDMATPSQVRGSEVSTPPTVDNCQRIWKILFIISSLYQARDSLGNNLIVSPTPSSFFSSTIWGCQVWNDSVILRPNSLYPDLVGEMHGEISKEKTTLIPLIWIYLRMKWNKKIW